MKKILFALGMFFSVAGHAQMSVGSGGIVSLDSGAVVCIQGDLDARGDVAGLGTVVLGGAALQRVNLHGFGVPCLRLENGAGVLLDGDLRVRDRLVFGAGRIRLGSANLFLSVIDGYDRHQYIVTDGTGMVVRDGIGDEGVVFPVGSENGGYRPVVLTQGGTVRVIGVRAIPGVLPGAALGMSWQVKDLSPGYDALAMTVGWTAADELPGFERSRARMARLEGDHTWVQESSGLVAGNDFGVVAKSLSKDGVFSVLSGPVGESVLRVFPNPARTGFFVDVQGRCVLTLVDREGKLVRSREVDSDANGPVYFGLDGGMAAGVYFLRVIRAGAGAVERSKEIEIVRD